MYMLLTSFGVLEYSYWVNLHQAKSSLPSLLGNITGTFNRQGELLASELSSSLSGSRMELIYPSFDIRLYAPSFNKSR